ncbi:hypothetical protein G6F50_017800 [Rhizopus delemar]|uniref:Uncharacterized protein n=1 Tax=Rhizopus delemar TaxID=936053 RepID=A0A9P7BZ98_9FUNG|nr:hypothetical protein G6F50_017800 [Rhizopus delemar]
MRDPAYARGAEGYNGRYGPSWRHRWAMAEKKPKDFYAGEPVVPKWYAVQRQLRLETGLFQPLGHFARNIAPAGQLVRRAGVVEQAAALADDAGEMVVEHL